MIIKYLNDKKININFCNCILSKFCVMRHLFENDPSSPIIALDLSATTFLFPLHLLPYHHDLRIMIYFRLCLMLGYKWILGRCTGVHCTRGDVHRWMSHVRHNVIFLDVNLQ